MLSLSKHVLSLSKGTNEGSQGRALVLAVRTSSFDKPVLSLSKGSGRAGEASGIGEAFMHAFPRSRSELTRVRPRLTKAHDRR